MKTYLVGGAVRDDILGVPSKDRDYVVVGATPEDMLARGFDQVGADFPVFLHPTSKHEYALARTERKTGSGYNGFTTDFNPTITLEDDLRRRDLTINAMAKDLNTGEIIDPFGGRKDLMYGILRHVSPAFAEDPLRVLRVARFQARYEYNIAPDTFELMKDLVAAGEIDHLTPERVWLELEKAFSERMCYMFVTAMIACGAWQRLFPEFVNGDVTERLRYTSHLSFHEKMVVLFSRTPRDSALAILERFKAPAETVRLVTMFKDLEAGENWEQNTAYDVLNLLKKLDAYRRPEDFKSLMMAAAQTHCADFSSSMNGCFVYTKNYGFGSLTAEEQNTLKGKAVGEAIDKLRLRALGVDV